MKIAIDVSQMAYIGTGVGRYTHDLVEALLSLETPHEFILWAGTFRKRSYFEALRQTKPWNKASWHLFPLPPKIAALVFNHTSLPFERLIGNYDLLHSSDWAEPSSRFPKVTTVHDLVFRKYPSTVDPLIRETQTRRILKLQQSTTVILADSLSTKNDLIAEFSFPASRIQVVYPGVSQRYSPPSLREIQRVKTKYNLPPQFILSVGTQEPRKNLERLAKSAEELAIPLILVGRYGWGSQTQTLGYVPDVDLPALYNASAVFAYPSLYEGFGFPVLEAMACGTAVVTSNVSSLPEVAGDAAVLVDPSSVSSIKSGIVQAIKSREKLISKGYTQAKKFAWSHTAQAVMEVYEKASHRN